MWVVMPLDKAEKFHVFHTQGSHVSFSEVHEVRTSSFRARTKLSESEFPNG